MPLLDLMRDTPDAVEQFTIEQAVTMAGNGDVRDGSDCSHELRKYFSQISSDKLFEHIDRCLSSSFKGSGFVLQDIVNELGCRLGYNVEHGLYRGRTNTINFDGVWVEPSESQILIEVKTTDAYRINLDIVATYRENLIEESRISKSSSILLIVGREDTGDLEAQIRGSKHAWDTRVISVESLTRLVRIKESADEDMTIAKIRSLLTPFEYTRLDNIIDVMFTATKDVESALEPDPQITESKLTTSSRQTSFQQQTPTQTVDALRRRILSTLAERDSISLIAHKRALFWTPDHDVRAACTISKRYDGYENYWYAYHPQWDDFLDEANVGYFILGCLNKEVAYVLPHAEITRHLSDLNTTTKSDGKTYWHVKLKDDERSGMELILPGDNSRKPISRFALKLK